MSEVKTIERDGLMWQISLTLWILTRLEITLEGEQWSGYWQVDSKFLKTIRNANKVAMKSLEKAMDRETAHKFAMSVVSLQPCTLFETGLGRSESAVKGIVELLESNDDEGMTKIISEFIALERKAKEKND